jgi:hypothetical protein
MDSLSDLTVLPPILGEVRREFLFMPLVVQTICRRVFGWVAFAPLAHRLTRLVRVFTYPLAAILAAPV